MNALPLFVLFLLAGGVLSAIYFCWSVLGFVFPMAAVPHRLAVLFLWAAGMCLSIGLVWVLLELLFVSR